MARKPLRPLIRSGGFYSSRKWTPLVYAGGYATANGGGEPEPPPIEKTIIGNPIHITDALAKPVQALSVALEPIQDLHGYDNPWPAGGGKNKLYVQRRNAFGIVGEYNDAGEYVITGTADTTTAYCDFQQITLPAGSYVFSISTIPAGVTSVYTKDGAWAGTIAQGTTFTLTQETIIGGYFSIPVGTTVNVAIRIQLESGSTATAWTPYSNLCPISGHADADVARTGVNVWDEECELGAISTSTGQQEASSTTLVGANYIPVKPSTSYYVKTSDNIYLFYYKADKSFIRYHGATIGNATFKTPDDCAFIRIGMRAAYGTTYHNDISINYPATDTSYHAYSGTTYPIPLGTTVYGGTLDVLTGVLTVTMAMVDLGTLTWTQAAITSAGAVYHNRWYSNAVSNMSGAVDTANGICSQYAVVPYSGSSSNPNVLLNGKRDNVASSEVRGYIQIVDSAKDNLTAADFKAAMSGVQFCYELATPQTYQLTPTEVALLLGENNIWSDGEMTLVYLADGNASDVEALNILLGNRYVNNHTADEPTDREALNIILGGNER